MKYKFNYLGQETAVDLDGEEFLKASSADLAAYADRACGAIGLAISEGDRPDVLENLRILQMHGNIVAARLSLVAPEVAHR